MGPLTSATTRANVSFFPECTIYRVQQCKYSSRGGTRLRSTAVFRYIHVYIPGTALRTTIIRESRAHVKSIIHDERSRWRRHA